jgi:predicted PurR-regulated permease PerM
MGGDTFGVLGMIIGIVVGAALAIIGILESLFYKKRMKTKIEG